MRESTRNVCTSRSDQQNTVRRGGLLSLGTRIGCHTAFAASRFGGVQPPDAENRSYGDVGGYGNPLLKADWQNKVLCGRFTKMSPKSLGRSVHGGIILPRITALFAPVAAGTLAGWPRRVSCARMAKASGSLAALAIPNSS